MHQSHYAWLRGLAVLSMCCAFQCEISRQAFSEEYSAIAEDMGIFNPQTGESCSLSAVAKIQSG